jgi:hypothetical protein
VTKTGSNATSYALRGLLVILVALGSLAPATPSIASRANPAGPAPTSQTSGGWSDDASGPAPLRAEAMAFATAVYLRQRAVLDAVAVFDSSLGAIIRASDDALQPDGSHPNLNITDPPCNWLDFRPHRDMAVQAAISHPALVSHQTEAYVALTRAMCELDRFTMPDGIPATPDSLRLASEVNRWNTWAFEAFPYYVTPLHDPAHLRAQASEMRTRLGYLHDRFSDALSGFNGGLVDRKSGQNRLWIGTGAGDIDEIIPLAAWPDPAAQYRMAYEIAVGASSVVHADRVAQYLADQTRRERIRQAVGNRTSHPSSWTYFGDTPLEVRAGTDPESPIVGTLEPGDLVELGVLPGGDGDGTGNTPPGYPVGIVLATGQGQRGYVTPSHHAPFPERTFVAGPEVRADLEVDALLTCIRTTAPSSYPCDDWWPWHTEGRPNHLSVNASVIAKNASTPAVAERVLAQAGLDAFHDRVVRAVTDRVANQPWDIYVGDAPLTVRADTNEDGRVIATIMPGDRMEVLGAIPVISGPGTFVSVQMCCEDPVTARTGRLVKVVRVRIPASGHSGVEGYVVNPDISGYSGGKGSSLLTVGRSQRWFGPALADVPAVTDRAVRAFLETSNQDYADVEAILDSPQLPVPLLAVSSIRKFPLGAANQNGEDRTINLFDLRTGAHFQVIGADKGSGWIVAHFDHAGFDLIAARHTSFDGRCCRSLLSVTSYRWDGSRFAEVSTVVMLFRGN